MNSLTPQSLCARVVDAMPMRVFWKDTQGHFLGANRAFLDDLQLSHLDELIGRTDLDFFDHDIAEAFRADDQEIIATGQAKLGVEQPLTMKGDDAVRWLETNTVPMRDEAGDVVGLLVTYQDITQRKLSQEKLLAAERAEKEARARFDRQRLLDITDNAPGAIFEFSITAQGEPKFLFLSAHFADLVGVPNDEILADWTQLLRHAPPSDVIAVKQSLDQSHDTLSAHAARFRVTMKRETRWIETRSEPKALSNGDVVWYGHMSDVTAEVHQTNELIAMREKAEAANRAKSAFLANMSHELRTPLNTVLGMATVLQRDALTAKQTGRLDAIQQSGQALLHLIDDILDLSKIESGAADLETVRFELEPIMTFVKRRFAPKAQAKDLKFSLTIDPSANGAFWADPSRIRQVLTNLLSNAVKFTEVGEVSCTVRADPLNQDDFDKNEAEAQVMLNFTVADTGPGLSPAQVENLFEPFTQADETVTRQHGGTGLGLAICRELCALMGGAITVDTDQGRGAIFSFGVKARRAADQEAPPVSLRRTRTAKTANIRKAGQ